MNTDPLASHLEVNAYGSFRLTDAVRPGPGVPIRPRQGYRTRVFRDRSSRLRIPMLSAAISSEHLFETFLALLEPLGESVHVVLESSHGVHNGGHRDYRRNDIDIPVLASHFCDYEDLLMNDGCTGVAIMNASKPIELQFDEHKLLHVYAPNLKPFQRILKSLHIRKRVLLPLISEGEHFHHTTESSFDDFQMLCTRVGVAEFDRVLSDEF